MATYVETNMETMCGNICVNMCLNICLNMCVNKHVNMCVNICIHECKHVLTFVRMGVKMEICVNKGLNNIVFTNEDKFRNGLTYPNSFQLFVLESPCQDSNYVLKDLIDAIHFTVFLEVQNRTKLRLTQPKYP